MIGDAAHNQEVSERPPLRVKFMMKSAQGVESENLIRRFPKAIPVWNNCEFTFDYDAREYDWLVVYDDLPPIKGERFGLWEEPLTCPRENTLLVTTEPSTIKTYGRQFLAQFGQILTSQEPWAVPHTNTIFSQPALLWFYGRTGNRGSHDEMSKGEIPIKSNELSTVCSSKKQKHTLHNARYQFVQKIKKSLPELDIFGHGVNPIVDKADALDAYRYHLAIENHVCNHHWTEKLSDAFLGYCLPFYFGCPNVLDYFPKESMIFVDLYEPEAAVRIIRDAIQNGEYERRLPAIKEARRLVIERYGIFAEVSRIIQLQHSRQREGRLTTGATLMSRHAIRNRHPFNAIRFGLEKMYARSRHLIARS